jgi:hypothetical protein
MAKLWHNLVRATAASDINMKLQRIIATTAIFALHLTSRVVRIPRIAELQIAP